MDNAALEKINRCEACMVIVALVLVLQWHNFLVGHFVDKCMQTDIS